MGAGESAHVVPPPPGIESRVWGSQQHARGDFSAPSPCCAPPRESALRSAAVAATAAPREHLKTSAFHITHMLPPPGTASRGEGSQQHPRQSTSRLLHVVRLLARELCARPPPPSRSALNHFRWAPVALAGLHGGRVCACVRVSVSGNSMRCAARRALRPAISVAASASGRRVLSAQIRVSSSLGLLFR